MKTPRGVNNLHSRFSQRLWGVCNTRAISRSKTVDQTFPDSLVCFTALSPFWRKLTSKIGCPPVVLKGYSVCMCDVVSRTRPGLNTSAIPACLSAFLTIPDADAAGGVADGGDDGDGAATVAGIATAAVLIPLVALAALFCCWRRRKKRKEGALKGPSGAAVAGGAGGASSRGYGRDGEKAFSFADADSPVVAVVCGLLFCCCFVVDSPVIAVWHFFLLSPGSRRNECTTDGSSPADPPPKRCAPYGHTGVWVD